MTKDIFKKAFFISLFGHLAVFSIFNLSFGYKFSSLASGTVSFWGQFLSSPKITNIALASGKEKFNRYILSPRTEKSLFNNNTNAVPAPVSCYFKPSFAPVMGLEKKEYLKEVALSFAPRERPKPTLIFHPVLPYWFSLYFKDRQVAHVELVYNITASGNRNFVDIKRKVSSGNPEVDFLIMRNMEHYLFIQQPGLNPTVWQTIKIDLSGKND